MQHRRHRLALAAAATAAVVSVALCLPLPAVRAQFPPPPTETFDLYIHSFCSPGSNCGSPSEAEYRAKLLGMVQHLNDQWRVHGISFRPTIFTIRDDDPLAYNTTGCNADDPRNPHACSHDPQQVCTDDGDCAGDATCDPVQYCSDLSTVCDEHADCTGIGNELCRPLNRQHLMRVRDEVAVPVRGAISLLLFEGSNTCCSNPPSPDDTDADISAIYCDGARDEIQGGSIFSHEMGHYWCLSHTFTGYEPEDLPLANFPGVTEVPHDGDEYWGGVFDTWADPQITEEEDNTPRCDNALSTSCARDTDCPPGGTCRRDIYNPGHDYCVRTVAVPPTDPGSRYGTYCETECRRCEGGICNASLGFPGNESVIPYDPFEHNAMSYYGWQCRAPFSVQGTPYWPFSNDQLLRVDQCRTAWPRRADLVDVCEGAGEDTDHDGICQDDDICPDHPNVDQGDRDGDGHGDACDLCPDDPQPTGDIDGDGIGDACDPDRDNDGCLNEDDQHPDEALQVSGVVIQEGPCESGQYDDYAYEGNDTDGDGVLDCEDRDDDNDGMCDENETLGPSEPGVPSDGCFGPDPCPTRPGSICVDFAPGNDCIDPWLECFGGNCNEYYAIWELVVNPDPTSSLVLSDIRIYNQLLIAAAPASMTPATVARQISGQALAGRGPAEAYRISLWRRGNPDVFVGVLVDSFTPSQASLGEIGRGHLIAIEEGQDANGDRQVFVRTAYGPGEPAIPEDDDDVPSFLDNCRLTYNPDQRDSDGDGFGDACDGDVNNDGIKDATDLALVNSCDGVDVSVDVPLTEPDDLDLNALPGQAPGGFETAYPPDPIIEAAQRCARYDLNGDGRIDYEDRNIVEGGSTYPGPSGRIDRAPIADAGPDRAIECGASFPISGSASFDPDGSAVTCTWSSPTCTFEVATNCDTYAGCPPGGVHTLQLTVQDGTHAVSDAFLADAQGCSPGSLGDSLRVGRVVDGRLQFSWSDACSVSGTAFAMWEGNLDAADPYASLTPRSCSVQSGFVTGFSNFQNAFYLIVPRGAYLGSFGRDSAGVERPAPTEGLCALPQALGAECSAP